jgi:hypothetical protein
MNPETPPPVPDAVTPADVLTPHDDPEQKPTDEPATDPVPGIVDPRRPRSGPEILEPEPPGLPTPPG